MNPDPDPDQRIETSGDQQRESNAGVDSSTSCVQGGGGGTETREEGGGSERGREGEVVGGNLDMIGDQEDVSPKGGPEEDGGRERDEREDRPTDDTHLRPDTAVVSSDSQVTDIDCGDKNS